MRLFVAITFPAEVVAHLRSAQEILQPVLPDISWSPPDKIHLTLKFLGELPGPQIPALTTMLQTLPRFGPIDLHTVGAETFPPGRPTRVIVASVAGEMEKLGNLQENIERGCGTLGYPREHRPFRPHATLGRPKQVRRDLRVPVSAITARLWPGPAFTARQFALIESKPRNGGREYVTLAHFPIE